VGTYDYNWHRYYEPPPGGYISADPTEQFGEPNVYV
jgi:uncharacterized protein RhaS with RHS repeats